MSEDDAVHAFHEAGHVAIAAVLGISVRRATLDFVWTSVRPDAHHDAAIVALAGAAAEIRHCGHSPESQAQLWADAWAGDLSNALDHLDHLDRAPIAPALEQARQLVTVHWCSIRVVAQALLERGELSSSDIDALIGSRE